MALPKSPRTAKSQQINIRLTEFQSHLLDQAALAQGLNRTEFIIGAAIREAHETMDARTTIFVDNDTFEAFEKALDAPVPSNDELKDLFLSRSPWE